MNVLKTLVSYRLISPGSEWRLHREWYHRSAMSDLLGEAIGLVQKDKLYVAWTSCSLIRRISFLISQGGGKRSLMPALTYCSMI